MSPKRLSGEGWPYCDSSVMEWFHNKSLDAVALSICRSLLLTICRTRWYLTAHQKENSFLNEVRSDFITVSSQVELG
jgi:hypothetical protein